MPVIQRKGAQSSQGFGEFAQSSTAANYIEDYFSTYLYTGTGAAQTISNGIGLADTAAWSSYKLQQNTSIGNGVTTDSSGNFYVTGYANDGTNNYALIAKYSSSGVIQWQRKLQQNASEGKGISTDSSGNVYVVGTANDGSTDYIIIAKYDSSGTIQWQRKLKENNSNGNAITVDTSGNVYVAGSATSGSTYIIIAKYNSSGVIQWQRKLQEGGSRGYGIANDTSGNVYVTGYGNDGTPYFIISKYNSSGVIQWQRKLKEFQSYGYAVATDSSGNVYVTGSTYASGYIIIAKYDSSGAIQWQRYLNQGNSTGYGITTDSSGNVYVTGYATISASTYIIVSKYNSSGTIQWQSSLKQGASEGHGIANDTNGNVYITGIGYSSNYLFITTKLKQDGTATSGTAIVTLSTSAATDSAGTATESAAGATDSAAGATDSAGTATDSAGTATATSASVAAVTGGGGLVWLHVRSGTTADHHLYDTNRGATKMISSNTTGAEITRTNGLTAFTANGFSIGNYSEINGSGNGMASWTFRKQAKFFDIVTYTGDGSLTRQISHNLGSAPGCMIVKSLNNAYDWLVWHRSTPGAGYTLNLNTTAAAYNSGNWGFGRNTPPTSTVFTVGDNANILGYTYVAYLFAHDAGGFGAAGTDNVISCGSFTTDANGTAPEVTLGYEPQFVLFKRSTGGTGNWYLIDNMRGNPALDNTGVVKSNTLYANLINAESSTASINPTSTGFKGSDFSLATSSAYIYIAIRRGPMKTPTSGTSVFSPVARTGTGATATITSPGFAPDLIIDADRPAIQSGGKWWFDRLRSPSVVLNSTSTNAESSSYSDSITAMTNTGYVIGADTNNIINYSGETYINWVFQRAPGFFDEVCYTGTGANQNITHNLGVVPQLIIVKKRNGTARRWVVQPLSQGTQILVLNATDAQATDAGPWNNTAPTSSVFTVGADADTNPSGNTLVAYLFATVAGVSKVGSYTGTGALQTVNCGFTSGARFVLIKRTDSTGDWYVWDSARGISSSTDPYLLLNSTAAEVTGTNYVDTDTTGFKVTAAAPAALNANGGSYLFLAIA